MPPETEKSRHRIDIKGLITKLEKMGVEYRQQARQQHAPPIARKKFMAQVAAKQKS